MIKYKLMYSITVDNGSVKIDYQLLIMGPLIII